MSSPFKLSRLLIGHEQDVKDIACASIADPSLDLICSASRDTKVLSFTREGDASFHTTGEYAGHGGFVNAITSLPPSSSFPLGLIASGGRDLAIHIYPPSAFLIQPLVLLRGHTENICSLAPGIQPFTLCSASWDKTAKIWSIQGHDIGQSGKCLFSLTGHTMAVWDVIAVEPAFCLDYHQPIGAEPSPFFSLTASADKTIKLWRDASCIHTYQGHGDVVRGLVVLPALGGFASCSNDASIRGWSFGGDTLFILHGHESFIYSIALIPTTGEIVSSGEDRSLKIWKDNECAQTIRHPCVSLWSVCALPNGDIVSGGSDGILRIFTRAPERFAPAQVIKVFEDAVSSSAIPAQQVGDVDSSKLPGPDALLMPGTKEGEVRMIKSRTSVEAHQWSSAEQNWIKIGDVVDAVGSSRKQIYDGKEYDYVFDIDIQEGAPPLKLPYNVSENPYNVAQTFLEANELPSTYLDQIADFLIKNTKGVSIGQSAARNDPYHSSPAPAPPPPSVPAAQKYRYFPVTDYVFFRAANLKAIFNKLVSLNVELPDAHSYLILQDGEVSILSKVVDKLALDSSCTLSQQEWNILTRVAFGWPVSSRFPGLDLLRMSVLYSNLPKDESGHWTPIVEQLLIAAEDDVTSMLACRTLCNLLVRFPGQNVVYSGRSDVLAFLRRFVPVSKGSSIARATLLLDMVILMNYKKDFSMHLDLLKVVSAIDNSVEPDAFTRLSIALGTLVSAAPDLKAVALQLGWIDRLSKLQAQNTLAEDLMHLLTSQ